MSKTEEKEKKQKWLIIILSIGIVICLAVAIWALFFRSPDVTLTPDYAPQDTEQNAEPIPGDDDSKLDAEEGGGAIGIDYQNTVTIDQSEGCATLDFANPGKSTQDMVLQIVIQDEIIVQSGIIKAGNQVKSLDLLEGAEKKLQEGMYEGKFVVLSYNPKTGEKAMVNTELEITVTVQK